MKMNMEAIMQPSKGTPNEGLSHKTGKTGVAVLKSAMCNVRSSVPYVYQQKSHCMNILIVGFGVGCVLSVAY